MSHYEATNAIMTNEYGMKRWARLTREIFLVGWLFFIFIFLKEAMEWRADTEGLGDEGDCSAWCKILKESIKKFMRKQTKKQFQLEKYPKPC